MKILLTNKIFVIEIEIYYQKIKVTNIISNAACVTKKEIKNVEKRNFRNIDL